MVAGAEGVDESFDVEFEGGYAGEAGIYFSFYIAFHPVADMLEGLRLRHLAESIDDITACLFDNFRRIGFADTRHILQHPFRQENILYFSDLRDHHPLGTQIIHFRIAPSVAVY